MGLVLMGGAMLSKSLIQFSVDGWGCIPSLLFGLRPNYQPTPPAETPADSQASLTQTIEWEKLEIPSRKLETPREHFTQSWAQ